MFGKSLIVFVFVFGLACAFEEDREGRGGRGGHGGHSGHGGGHSNGRSCLIVDASVTNCTGATGTNCTDSAAILALVQAGTTSVNVCRGFSSTPVTQTIQYRVPYQECRGRRCTCFLVPVTETRTCDVLFADATFTKNSCSNQSVLATYAATAPSTVRVCVVTSAGTIVQSSTVTIVAGVGERH